MKRDQRLPFAQWADINRADRFISVEPLSGYSMVQREDEGYVIYLPPDASDDVLGRALLEALDKSRFIWPPDEEMEFFKAERLFGMRSELAQGNYAPLWLYDEARTL